MFQGKGAPRSGDAGCGGLGEAFGGENLGCGQCPHFGSRTGPYRCRTGPDSLFLGGSPVFAGAGTRFESHLGHVFSLFRGFLVFFRVHIVHTPASDLWLGCVVSRAAYLVVCGSGRLRRYRPVVSLVGFHPRSSLPVDLLDQHFMVVGAAYNMIADCSFDRMGRTA